MPVGFYRLKNCKRKQTDWSLRILLISPQEHFTQEVKNVCLLQLIPHTKAGKTHRSNVCLQNSGGLENKNLSLRAVACPVLDGYHLEFNNPKDNKCNKIINLLLSTHLKSELQKSRFG